MKAKNKIKETKTKDIKPKSGKDKFVWLLVIILLSAAIVADFYYKEIAWPLRLAGWIVFACVLIILVFQTKQGKSFWKFAKEARIELRKVVWPDRPTTVRTTALVIGLVVLTALIMWGIDSILLFIIGWLTGQRG